MSNFVNDIIKNANDQIKYKETVVTGEVTADNGDGTYDVKIANAPTAYPNVLTATYGDTFSVGEIAIITFEYGNKEMPRLWGHAKKIKQTPKVVEVDYSSGEGGGLQTVEKTIYSNTANGCVSSLASGIFGARSYAVLHALTSADSTDLNLDDGWIGQRVAGGLYEIYRCLLIFDTSAIPAGATITSATLSIYPEDLDDIVTNFYIVIQDGQPNYPHNPAVSGDYYYANYGNNGGQINTSGLSINSYHVITLNSNGLAWITKGGTTKLCLRSSRDIAGITPTGEEYFYFWNLGDTTKRPKLVITYTI